MCCPPVPPQTLDNGPRYRFWIFHNSVCTGVRVLFVLPPLSVAHSSVFVVPVVPLTTLTVPRNVTVLLPVQSHGGPTPSQKGQVTSGSCPLGLRSVGHLTGDGHRRVLERNMTPKVWDWGSTDGRRTLNR